MLGAGKKRFRKQCIAMQIRISQTEPMGTQVPEVEFGDGEL